MGQVNNLLLLEKGLRADFVKAFNNGENPADVMPAIMETNSTAASEKYGWLGESPDLRLWVDERQLSGLNDYDYELTNLDYEATLKIDKNVMDDDQLGAVKVRIADLAARARNQPRKLFFEGLIAGTTELCYDGQAMFSNAHPESGSAQDNLLGYTCSGASPTVAELKLGFTAARAAIRGYQDDQAQPRNEGELDLRVYAPVGQESAWEELINAQIISNTTNVLKGAAKVITTSRLSSAKDFYVIDASGVLKPFILQNRQALEFEIQNKGERTFMRKEILAGVNVRRKFGYGLWAKAVKQVG